MRSTGAPCRPRGHDGVGQVGPRPGRRPAPSGARARRRSTPCRCTAAWTSARPSRRAAEQAEVPHHLIDLADPAEDFTVARFQADARAALADIEARGHRALLVGGTGLYLRAVVDDLDIPGRWPDVRAELEAEVAAVGPRAAARPPRVARPGRGRAAWSRRTPRRIVRALEVTLGSGRPFSSHGPGLGDARRLDASRSSASPSPPTSSPRASRRATTSSSTAGFLDEVRAPGGAARPASRAPPARRSATRSCSPTSTASSTSTTPSTSPSAAPAGSPAASGRGSAATPASVAGVDARCRRDSLLDIVDAAAD